MDEKALRGLLERLAETEQPMPQVDVAQARQDGRRKLRWRRAALIGAPVVAVVVAAVLASGLVSLGPDGQRPGRPSPAGQSPARPPSTSPSPSAGTGRPTQPRYAGAGHHYLRPGFVSEALVSSSRTKLVLQAPPSVTRWTLDGTSCSVHYTMIKKTPWGGIPGSGGGSGAAGCPFAPHLSVGAHDDSYSDGVYFSVLGGKANPATGVRVRVTLANGAQTIITPDHAMWLVIVQRCGAYNKTAFKSVALLDARGAVIAQQAVQPGLSSPARPPC
jgi:hypothetical protein